ncbi:MAG: hypothetical protein J6I86_08020 [Bacteroidaceae bacterium]|nr:hypothetical protein [Bacteroidaceae bacterium]
MKRLRFAAMLLAMMVGSIQAWSYRITDNYTIESKFKINTLGAGIAFRAYEGFNGSICMWQFNVGADGTKSLFRPHDWKVGGILLAEINTADKGVALNTTNWFVTKIVVTNGSHADTYLRRADQTDFVLIDSRDGNFRFGLVGTRQDHDGNVNESASYDYFKVTANETGDVLYYEDFDATNGDWRNDPIWDSTNGFLTTEGRNLSEVKYFPNNMFLDAVPLHYAVEADMTFVNGFASLIFGLDESNGGSNYMWQISPGYSDGASSIVCNYYHLDYGNESWKAHAKGPDFPGIDAIEFYDVQHHVKIEVKANVVYTYIDGTLVDTFTQCDMTDLALLNSGKMGIRVDAGNGVMHDVYIDNVKLTEFDDAGTPTVVMEDGFDGGAAHYFELSGKNATYAKVEDVDGDYALHITCDGTTDKSAKVRLIQTDDFVCTHNYENGICTICGEYEEPGYDTDLSAYTIGNLGQLIRFSQIVNGGETGAKGSLTADIDMEYSDLFQPIGLNNDGSWQKPFTGTFYGNNHVISNLFVKTECEGGLFSRTRGGKIYNLGLVNGHIESTANLRCGAMAGEHHDNAIIENCYARGTFEFVTSHAQKDAMAGETAGGHFINCYTTLPKMSCDYPMSGDKTNSYEGVTAEQGASGEITYKLGDAFFQTIGEDAYPELDNTHGVVFAMESAGYATLYNDEDAGTLSSNVSVFTGKQNGEYLTLTKQQNTIPAQTPVILKGEDSYYSFTPAASAPAITGENDLLGTVTPIAATGSEYALAQKDGEVGFYKVSTGTTIPAGKAYLVSSSEVKGFIFDESGATGISEVESSKLKVESPIYNIAGQRLQKMQKGINIINGKKVLK